MEQRRSRLVAPDATGLRARILSTGGLLVVAGMVLVVLVLLFPRRELIDRLRAERRNDELSVSYLANLLTSEPDNDELRVLLAERHFALRQADRAEAALAPIGERAMANPETRLRLSRLRYSLLELRANAAAPGGDEAQRLREALVAGLNERLLLPWSTPDLLMFARKAVALEQLGLAQRFHARIRFDADGDRAPWFEEAVRTALWAQDYAGAAMLHRRAMEVTPLAERQRAHLLSALRILQSGNLLDAAMDLARRHDDVVGADAAMLDYLTRLALAANRPDLADGYARRMMRMGPSSAQAAPALLRWLGRGLEALLPAAHAQQAARAGAEPAPIDAERAPLPPDDAASGPARIAAGDPRLPFDDGAYTLAYQTFLANRNLNDAWRVAGSAVRQRPDDILWRERLAQVCEWSGRPDEAMQHWRELVRLAGGDRERRERALQGVLRLAPGLQGDEAVLATWRDVAATRRLTTEEVLGVVALSERLGWPEEGMAWLVEADRRQPSRILAEARTGLAERMGDLPAAMEALRQVIARDGVTPARAVRLATFHGLRGETAQAYEVLAPLADRVGPGETAYWRLLASVAWSLQVEDRALQALQVVTGQGDFMPLEAERLLALLRTRQPREAARFAERAWRHLRTTDYLVAALELWWNERDMAEMERLFAAAAADPETTLALDGEAYFWMLRSQWRQARGEMLAALSDMRRALDAEPDEVGIRVSYLFMLIEAGGKGELQRLLGTWLEDATRQPAYDAAYAAGYMELDLPRRALPFWRRQAPLLRDDPMWNGSYADVLEAAGQPEAARRVRGHALALTRDRLATLGARADAAATPELMQSLRLQLARLMLASTQGDANLRTMRGLLGPGGLMAAPMLPRIETAARELVLGWMLSAERHDQARLWLWRRHGRTVLTPAWVEMSMALHEGDLPEVGRLMDGPDGERLPPALRADALQALGHVGRAQSLRAAHLDLHDADDALHETWSDLAWARARRLEVDAASERDAVRADRLSVAAVLPLTEALRLRLSTVQARQRAGTVRATGLPAFGTLAADDRAAEARLLARPDRALGVELALGLREAERRFATASLSATAQVLARLQVQAGVELNARATESPALAVAGRRDELRLGADLRLSATEPLRVTLRTGRLSLQDGTSLGTLSALEWEAAHLLRGATPELRLRAFGQYVRTRAADGPLPGWTARLAPDGSLPGASFFVPESHALHGIGLSAGLADRDGPARAWRPFVDLSLTRHSRLGTGWSATVGAAGRLFGSDRWQVQYSTTRAGSAGDARSIGMRYLLPF